MLATAELAAREELHQRATDPAPTEIDFTISLPDVVVGELERGTAYEWAVTEHSAVAPAAQTTEKDFIGSLERSGRVVVGIAEDS